MELVSDYIKVTRYKVNIQKSIEQLKLEIQKYIRIQNRNT